MVHHRVDPRKVNPKMITLARESRRMRQNDLANEVGIAQGTISKFENHELLLNLESLKRITKVLRYTEGFFVQNGGPIPSFLSYRRRDKVAQDILTFIDAVVNIRRLIIQKITTECEAETPAIPAIPASKKNPPSEIAKQVRKKWSMSAGPIHNLVHLLERNKVILFSLNFDTENVLSRPIITENNQLLIVYNNILLGDQLRFTIAYELGHLIMHRASGTRINQDLSHEANLFAAEFLMPESDIVRDLKEVNFAKKDLVVPLLGKLKKKWGVSMQSLLFRANDLGLITKSRKDYLLGDFKKMGIKTREPKEFDVPIEDQKYLKSLTKAYKEKLNLSDDDLVKKFGLPKQELPSFLIYN